MYCRCLPSHVTYTTPNFKDYNDVCCTNRSCEYRLFKTWKLVAGVTRYITKATEMKQILTWILRRKEAIGVAVDLQVVSLIAIIIKKTRTFDFMWSLATFTSCVYVCVYVCACMYMCVCVCLRVWKREGKGNIGKEGGVLCIVIWNV